jgi:putative endonuclease
MGPGSPEPATALSERQRQGRGWERAARDLLIRKGLRFREANYRTRFGELDLVMEDREAVVMVEVRARASRRYGSALESVTRFKQARVVRAAMVYLMDKGLSGRVCRFDIVVAGEGGLEHFPNAFSPPAGRYTL